MKSFILACVVLLVIIIYVAFASFYSIRVTDNLLAIATKLPEDLLYDNDFSAILERFITAWEKSHSFIHFTVGHSENDAISDALDDIHERQKSGDLAGYLAARARLISAIEKIQNAESLSLDTIF